ncbi:hypothetical protein D3C87_1670440 [compost metagenome]
MVTGLMVIVAVALPVTRAPATGMVSTILLSLSLRMYIFPEPLNIASLKLSTILALRSTARAPFAGTVLVTAGAAPVLVR